MKFDDLIDLCIDVEDRAIAAHAHLPERERRRAAKRIELNVASARLPIVAAHIEAHAEPVVVDELLGRRLKDLARPHIDAVLRDANVEGDVTERMLLTSTAPWVVAWRDRLCWLLARDGLSTGKVAAVVGIKQSGASKAIRRYAGRVVAGVGAVAKRAKGAT